MKLILNLRCHRHSPEADVVIAYVKGKCLDVDRFFVREIWNTARQEKQK